MDGISNLGPINNTSEEIERYAKRVKNLILGASSL
jgi:hypothetical protein